MPTKWLQERAKGSKNGHGMPPHTAFCGRQRLRRPRVEWVELPPVSQCNGLRRVHTRKQRGVCNCCPPKDMKLRTMAPILATFGPILRIQSLKFYQNSSAPGSAHQLKSSFHPAPLLGRIVERFRGGLVSKAHRLLYHSTIGSRVIRKRDDDTWQRSSTEILLPSNCNSAAPGVVRNLTFGFRV